MSYVGRRGPAVVCEFRLEFFVDDDKNYCIIFVPWKWNFSVRIAIYTILLSIAAALGRWVYNMSGFNQYGELESCIVIEISWHIIMALGFRFASWRLLVWERRRQRSHPPSSQGSLRRAKLPHDSRTPSFDDQDHLAEGSVDEVRGGLPILGAILEGGREGARGAKRLEHQINSPCMLFNRIWWLDQ